MATFQVVVPFHANRPISKDCSNELATVMAVVCLRCSWSCCCFGFMGSDATPWLRSGFGASIREAPLVACARKRHVTGWRQQIPCYL